MSDSNPFADPVHTERFDEKKGKAIRAESPSTPLIAPPPPRPSAPVVPSAPKKDLDDYNPFDDAQQPHSKPVDKPPRGAEGISWFGFRTKKYIIQPGEETSDARPPTYSDTNTAAMRELKQREDELAKREQAIREREENIGQDVPIRPNNFPPLPKFCPVKPCFYHDISVDIPPEQQRLVRGVLIWWIVHCVLYIINFLLSFIGMVAIIAVGNSDNSGTFFANFGLALGLLVLFLPASLFCLYLPLYRAFRNDSSMNFMCFFFVCVFQFGIYICHAFGIPGGCGFILSVFLFSSGGATSNVFLPILGGVYLIFGLFWLALAGVLAFFVYKVHRYYRLSGASLAAARQEMFTTAASNEALRSAVKTGIHEAATNEAVRSAVADGVKSGVKSGITGVQTGISAAT
ncbi:Secretory carrier-associated membrane protein 1-like isoform X2 [Oopsacas minuta]|uniref:Secretory carrier-associated membrane protein n=1 Tax=Oopsacas minuta TaxID=111878 RepID=A0AAV7K9M3_9METZ|nr:Secretory carrier-associated membrane protein 1-like isoform X2 [Oopsacas minuta]